MKMFGIEFLFQVSVGQFCTLRESFYNDHPAQAYSYSLYYKCHKSSESLLLACALVLCAFWHCLFWECFCCTEGKCIHYWQASPNTSLPFLKIKTNVRVQQNLFFFLSMISRHMDIQTVLRLEIVSTYVTSVQKTIGVVLGLNMVSYTVPGGMFK